jgi:hypothetical protein
VKNLKISVNLEIKKVERNLIKWHVFSSKNYAAGAEGVTFFSSSLG